MHRLSSIDSQISTAPNISAQELLGLDRRRQESIQGEDENCPCHHFWRILPKCNGSTGKPSYFGAAWHLCISILATWNLGSWWRLIINIWDVGGGSNTHALKEVLRGNTSFQPRLGIVISSEHYFIYVQDYVYIIHLMFPSPTNFASRKSTWWFWSFWIETEEWFNIFVNILIRGMPNLFLGSHVFATCHESTWPDFIKGRCLLKPVNVRLV